LKKETPLPLSRNDEFRGTDFEAGAALLVNKPAGITSFGVVRRVRKFTGVRKVGHCGTLDPAATGLLILLLGKATRHQQKFMGLDKEYLATIRLGLETTTWDLEGEVMREADVPPIDKTGLRELLENRFIGEIEQMPPVYSAIKLNGVPSYKHARRGREVVLKPRSVQLYKVEIESWDPPDFTLRLHCSSGFYVRSLAHDIGEAFGCGGTLKRLVRTRVGSYRLDDALELDDLVKKIQVCQT
jgi:tRNA pseudouridine55 synthase